MSRIDCRVEQIHPLDHNGTLCMEVVEGDHDLSYSWFWENCGMVGETIECSCGFYSQEHPGNGCWQYGHNTTSNHGCVDEVHARLLLLGVERAKAEGIGVPAEWRSICALATKDLKKQKGAMALIKWAQRLSA